MRDSRSRESPRECTASATLKVVVKKLPEDVGLYPCVDKLEEQETKIGLSSQSIV